MYIIAYQDVIFAVVIVKVIQSPARVIVSTKSTDHHIPLQSL